MYYANKLYEYSRLKMWVNSQSMCLMTKSLTNKSNLVPSILKYLGLKIADVISSVKWELLCERVLERTKDDSKWTMVKI